MKNRGAPPPNGTAHVERQPMTMTTSPILAGEKLDPAHQQKVLDEFYREGLVVIPGVLTAGEVNAIREVTDRCIDLERKAPFYESWREGLVVLRYTQSIDRLFCDMLVREPFLSLAEAILGPNCGFVGQNVIRCMKGAGISTWHVDDILEFPLPPEIPRHDARIRMPVFWFSFQIAISDIDGPENGPTEFVPGSHYSGRTVPKPEDGPIEFDGRGVKPVLCKAGDIYIFNHQLWHRGSENRSDRPRYLMQNQYCRAWGKQRFALKLNHSALSEAELKGASPRLMQLVGRG
jgi:hypothetical protein